MDFGLCLAFSLESIDFCVRFGIYHDKARIHRVDLPSQPAKVEQLTRRNQGIQVKTWRTRHADVNRDQLETVIQNPVLQIVGLRTPPFQSRA
jgi:hypothetical protein